MNDKTFLEKPIYNKEDDLFNITSYVQDLEKAIDDGAKFVAIDGEYGSGKSSLVNILERKEKIKDKKATFVNVNFLNINEDNLKVPDIENTIHNYHRYFVNQVANDICDNPFELEQLFYNSFISYSVTNPSKYKLWKIIVDKILLILTSYMIIFLTYKTFLQEIEELKFIFQYSDKINPFVLICMFVLIIIYGYGIYKPNKQEQSPMLEIDKCRNIFLKTVNTKLKKHLISKRKIKLFLIIDDLDRIKEDLQVKIISLLYNEYYPLKIKGVELTFIFMLNTHKIQNELSKNELSSDKLFDYILPISNNQKHIIRHLTNKMINEHATLNAIFNNDIIKNKEYIINLICKKCPTIRKIKHFFNKLITKYNYLKNSKVENINYDEMIIISLLLNEVETSTLDVAIANIINNERIDDDSAKDIQDILLSCNNKKIFDVDYYIYLYNFIDKDDILTHYENELYSISEKGYGEMSIEEDNKILEYLENEKVRFDKVFHEIFIYLDNDTKLVFTASKKFCDYLTKSYNFFENVDITNAYQNYYGYYLCDNITLTKHDRDIMILDLESSRKLYLSSRTSENANLLKTNFIQFLENMDSRIIHFNLKDYFSLIDINDEMFNLLFDNIVYNNMSIGFYLLNNKIFNCNYIKKYINLDFLSKINNLSNELSVSIKNQILSTDNISFDVIINIIGDEKEKYENLEAIYDRINCISKYIPFDKLLSILKNYGYNTKLDKHILHCLEYNEIEMVNFINKNHYPLSNNVLEKINSLTQAYKFTNYYENIFIDNEFYSLYIYSRILKSQKFDLNDNLVNNEKYKTSLLDIYKNISNWASSYPYTKRYTNFILEKFDFGTISFKHDDFWKITNHIPNIDNLSKFKNVLETLNSKDQFENFCDYCIEKSVDIYFIKFLRSYAEEFKMSKSIKIKLTKGINKII